MEVIEMLAKATEQPPGAFKGVENLSEIEAWDSLAILNFMALADSACGITLSAETLLGCETVEDVERLLESSRCRQ